MDKLRRSKTLASMAFTALAIVLAISAPSQVRARGGQGSGGGHSGGSAMHDGFDKYDGDYAEGSGDQAPAYYCPSYDAYYPSVTSCPEAWEPVPAS